jgi:hypothetical protein
MQVLSNIKYTSRYCDSVLCKVDFALYSSVTDNYLNKIIDTGWLKSDKLNRMVYRGVCLDKG